MFCWKPSSALLSKTISVFQLTVMEHGSVVASARDQYTSVLMVWSIKGPTKIDFCGLLPLFNTPLMRQIMRGREVGSHLLWRVHTPAYYWLVTWTDVTEMKTSDQFSYTLLNSIIWHSNKIMPACTLPTYVGTFLDIPVLNWLPYSPDMSPIEHLWDVLDRRVCPEWPPTSARPQLTTWWFPCVGSVPLCVKLLIDKRYWSLWIWTINSIVLFLSFPEYVLINHNYLSSFHQETTS